MRYATIVTCLAGLFAVGCAENKPEATTQPSSQITDMMIVDSINDSGIRTAIIVQHTLYAYHFGEGGAELNDLGKRDLAVLITHYKAHGGGMLSVRRGEAPDALYAARIIAVKDWLQAGGIDPATVQIADAPPGGQGISGNDAAHVMSKSMPEGSYESESGSAGGGGSSSSSTSGGTGTGTSSGAPTSGGTGQ